MKTQNWHGVPLQYMAEKISLVVHSNHWMYYVISAEEIVSMGSTRPNITPEFRKLVPFKGCILDEVRSTFYQSLKVFLTLHGLLQVIDQEGLTDRLLAMDRKQFSDWMQHIEAEGQIEESPPPARDIP